jgi:nucleotide-binding universal stress UspA family protein
MGRIVVGVDGSAAAGSALRWALAHAAGEPVEAWHAWHPGSDPDSGAPPDERALEATARATLDAAVAGAGVRAVLVRAIAASALIDAGRDAELVAVGGPVGSVGRYVVEHAPCPVVVVPAGWALSGSSG